MTLLFEVRLFSKLYPLLCSMYLNVLAEASDFDVMNYYKTQEHKVSFSWWYRNDEIDLLICNR